MGKDRSIAYTSRVFKGCEVGHEAYEEEALAVIHSAKAFRPYMNGTSLTIITDHRPLIWFKTADFNR